MKKLMITLLTTLFALTIAGTANAYCVQNKSGATIKVERTNCDLPGDSPMGCEYRVKAKTCELNGNSKTSHLWVYSSDDKLLCSVNVDNSGDTLKVNGTNGKSKCEVL